MYEHELDDGKSTFELNIDFDPKAEEYVAAYLIDGEIRNVGRGSSSNRAVTRLAEQMNGDVADAL